MCKHCKNINSSGFTLLEVVVATALLAAGVLIASQNFSASLRGIRTSQEYMAATSLANNKIVEISLRQPLLPAKERGQWEGFVWEAEVSPTELLGKGLEATKVAVMMVTVKVFWGKREVQLWTLKSIYQKPSS